MGVELGLPPGKNGCELIVIKQALGRQRPRFLVAARHDGSGDRFGVGVLAAQEVQAVHRVQQFFAAQVGFDLGYYFLRGLAIFGDNLEERHERVPALPYQNPYWFQQQGEKDGFVNTFVELVHYTTFQTIDLITRDR